jgi:hypothetical protein
MTAIFALHSDKAFVRVTIQSGMVVVPHLRGKQAIYKICVRGRKKS